MTWTDISAANGSDKPPSARFDHGFASAGGKLYVHGGSVNDGTICAFRDAVDARLGRLAWPLGLASRSSMFWGVSKSRYIGSGN